MPTAFLTGCATGFGRALARRLLATGWQVAATDPDIEGLAAQLDPAGRERRLLLLPLDLRDDDSVREAVDRTLAWSPVDLLVNNGGYAVFGTQEEADLEAVRRLFDVNVLGAARVTRALLPTLRRRAGTIVQVSSVAGRMAFPESGFYAGTKYALEAMSEALYAETCTFGIRVRLIEPGAFATQFLDRAREASLPRSPDSPYAHLHDLWDERKVGVLEAPQDPERVVDAILASLEDEAPFLRVPVGADAERILALRDALPVDAWARLLGARNGGPDAATAAGDVLSPGELLAGESDAASLTATRAAWRQGHLDHWTTTEVGRRALSRLRGEGC